MADKHKSKTPLPTRRRALLGFGMLGAGAAGLACDKAWTPAKSDAFGRSQHKPPVPGSEAWATHEERWSSTTCGQCPAGCGIRVRVVEGRAVGIEGNPDNPLNQGGVGPRGLAGLQVLYDPDRITGPMVRKNGKLVAATWDEAIAVVTSALTAVRDAGKPERLLALSGRERGLMNELLARFCSAFGTPNFIDGRPNRSAPIAQAMYETTGSYELPAYDWAAAKYVLSLEAGLVEDSCQAVYFTRVASNLKKNKPGVRPLLIHAGPAFDLAAHSADQWLKIKPGTSGALALGLCHLLLARRTFDTRIAEHQGEALDVFRDAVSSYNVETVSAVCGIAPDRITRLADELWTMRPSFAVIDDRSVGFDNGLDTARATLALNTLLGAVESTEGGVRIAADLPYREWPPLTLDELATAALARPRLDKAGAPEFPSARSIVGTLPEALGAGNAVDVALLYYANPTYARAQPKRWREALAKVPMVVSFSPFLDETTLDVANVVLPDHTYLERYEDAGSAPGLATAVVGVRRPVVAPLHDTRDTGDVLLQIARGIGGPVAAALPWTSSENAFDARLLGLHDTGRGSIRAASESQFRAQLREAGVWVDAAPPSPRPVTFAFSGKWLEPGWHGDASSFPLKLLLYRRLGHAEGSGANQPWLQTLRGRPGERAWTMFASVHPSSAPGLSTGDMVTVASEWGQVRVPVRIERRMEPGYVALPLGGGHTAMGRFAKGIGVNGMELAAPQVAPGSGATVLSQTRVRLITEAGRG